MRIFVLPREAANPYQDLLYAELSALGARVTYLGEWTSSHTLNVILLPFEALLRGRERRAVIHLHWVHAFLLPGATRSRAVRRLGQAWFRVWLWAVRMGRRRLVWTAHNVLPHGSVFADDLAARRMLLSACDLVLVHSQDTLDQLGSLGGPLCRSAIVPHGPFHPAGAAASMRVPGTNTDSRRFLFFGKILPYKGVQELVAAFKAMPDADVACLTIAGRCDEVPLRSELMAFARWGGSRVTIDLGHVPDQELASLLASCDVVVLPYRRITTSGSAMLALAAGRPLIIPDHPSLAQLPAKSVFRYDGSVQGLRGALAKAINAGSDQLAAMSMAARVYASEHTWEGIAAKTLLEMTACIDRVSGPKQAERLSKTQGTGT